MLSVIIPTYNEEKYLPQLLRSIGEQNLRDFEVIVADNNSRDKTTRITRETGCRIVEGGPPPVGRNCGAKAARGDLLLFLDADTILPDNFLSHCILEFNSRRLDVATCFLKTKGNRLIDKGLFYACNLGLFICQFMDPHASGSFILCKRRAFRELGGFRESLKQAEDHDFVQRAKRIGKFRMLYKSLPCSTRRLEKEGRMRVLKKYIRSEIYRKLKGDINTDLFKYEYGEH